MKKLGRLWLVLAVLLGAPVVGCAPDISPDTYGVGSVGQVNRVVRGVVVSVRDVAVQGTRSGLGSGAGAMLGMAGGSGVGGGQGGEAVAGMVAGAVVGGLAGAALEESATQQRGYEYVVETARGALLTVV